MTAPKGLVRTLVAAAFALAALAAACDSVARAFQRISPDLAARLAVSPGGALAAKADRLLITNVQRQVVSDQPAALARRALRSEPILPNALRSIGFVAGERGARAKAKALMLAAVGQSRREQFALLWLVDDAARQGRIGTALGWFDLALRTKDDVRQLLFPKLALALADPSVRQSFLPYARRKPSWLAPFYRATMEQPGGEETLAKILFASGGLPDGAAFRDIEQTLVARLVVHRQFELARRVYARMRNRVPALLDSPALTRASIDPRQGGMAWQLTDGVSVSGAFSTVNGHPALSAIAYAGQRGPVASKLLFLTPERYVLEAALARDLPATARPSWELRCAETDRLLFAVQPGAAGPWRFSIPADCRAQMLRLFAAGPDAGDDGEFTVSRVELKRADD